MLHSGFIEFKLDYSKTKDLAIGDAVYSSKFPAGGHVWRIKCYPRGHITDMDDKGEYLALYLELLSPAANVTAFFEAFLLRSDGSPSPSWHENRCVQSYPPASFSAWGWSHFMHRRHLASPDHLAADGRATFLCGVIVLRSGEPSSDVASDLGWLLESGDGWDVSFSVGGETFRAHRAVLAAQSPVMKAELLGPMAEAAMPTITIRDMDPATFAAMLRFIYTDALPEPEPVHLH